MDKLAVTNKGQVNIPKVVRQKLGIHAGGTVEFKVVSNHAELKLSSRPIPAVTSGAGMLPPRDIAPLSADFDVAILAAKNAG